MPRDARQPQQSHRRAAHAASPRAAAPLRGGRDGRESPGRDRRARARSRGPTIGLITNAGAEHLEGFGSLEGVARAEGEMVAGLDARRHRRHQRRRRVRRPVARHDARARRRRSASRRAADFTATRRAHRRSAPDGFVTRFTLARPLGRAAIELQLAGQHNVVERAGAAAAADGGGRALEHIVAGLAHDARRCRAGCSSRRAPAAPGSSTIPTTRTRARCAPASKCSRSSKARKLARARRHGRARRLRATRRTPRSARFAREHGIERAVRGRPRSRRSRSKSFGAGARVVRRHRRRWRSAVDAELDARRARADQGLAFEPPRARGRGAGRRRERTKASTCSTGSPQQLTAYYSGFNVFSYLTLRAILATVTALAFSLVVGPWMIARLVALPDRPGGARRRPEDASAEGRHADDGRRADPRRDPRRARCCGPTCATASCGSCSASRSRSASSASTTTT